MERADNLTFPVLSRTAMTLYMELTSSRDYSLCRTKNDQMIHENIKHDKEVAF